MHEMIIHPNGTSEQYTPYAAGRFTGDDAFVINQAGAISPFGGTMCCLGVDYIIELLPDGSGCTRLADMDVTASSGLGKAWYIKDRESGDLWSAFLHPVGEKADEYEVSYLPGQVSAYCLKNKIASTLTIATVPGTRCEVWRVHLENRSARDRTITFTTYIEPAIASVLEAYFRENEKTILMRRPLDSDDMGHSDTKNSDLVLFHSSTLPPIRYAIEKTGFIGEGRTLHNPEYLEQSESTGENGSVRNPIISMTVEVELPLEGVAEFGFSFGVAANPEQALRIAKNFSSQDAIDKAIDTGRKQWTELTGAVKVSTSDSTLDALINTWLPYETYSGWMRERSIPNYLDPARVADVLRCIYPLYGPALAISHESLLNFAAGLSILGSYSPDNQSLVTLSPAELMWLPISTARYVAETGDASILSESISLRDGPVLPLKEHCERIIRLCLNSKPDALDPGDIRLLAQTIRLWALVSNKFEDSGVQLESLKSRLVERTRTTGRRDLPRRARYLQSICPALNDTRIQEDVLDYLGSTQTGVGDVDTTCSLYSSLVEWTLGVNATYEGLILNPCLPDSWLECDITRQFRGDTYHIHIQRGRGDSEGRTSIVIDGEPVLGDRLPFFGDNQEHKVEVIID